MITHRAVVWYSQLTLNLVGYLITINLVWDYLYLSTEAWTKGKEQPLLAGRFFLPCTSTCFILNTFQSPRQFACGSRKSVLPFLLILNFRAIHTSTPARLTLSIKPDGNPYHLVTSWSISSIRRDPSISTSTEGRTAHSRGHHGSRVSAPTTVHLITYIMRC